VNFKIYILHDRQTYQLSVERVFLNEVKEQYKVSGRTSSMTLESNRPLFRNKGIKKRRPDWKVIEGRSTNSSILEKIIIAIMGMLSRRRLIL
jgi:hypothetical protein